MKIAKKGDKVKVHYTGRLSDGSVFDSSKDRDPLEFELGAGSMIAGFDKAVTGMQEGEVLTTIIAAKEAYGERKDDLVMKFERNRIPADIELKIGLQLSMQTAEGQSVGVLVHKVEEEWVWLDANHPLAGKELTFEIELVNIQAA